MREILHIIQIVSSLLLIALIMLQRTSGDTGSSFGDGSGSFMRSRRGAERFLFILSIIVAIVFAGISIAVIYYSK